MSGEKASSTSGLLRTLLEPLSIPLPNCLCVGDPGVGYLEPSSGDAASARLIEGAARSISRATGVSLGWLVEGQP